MTGKKIVFSTIFWTLLLAAEFCGAALTDNRQFAGRLVGFWYSTHKQDGLSGDIQMISHFSSDGSFYIRFRVLQAGRLAGEQSESGIWRVKNNIKTMVTTHINGKHLGKEKYRTNLYHIYTITSSKQIYEHLITGATFNATRVTSKFNFPDQADTESYPF